MANLGSKSKGPFGTLGRDYKVVSTIFLPFSDCTMSHVPPLSQYWKKMQKYLRLHALFKHTYNAQIFTKKLGLTTQKTLF